MLPWLVIPARAVAAGAVYLIRLPKDYQVRRSLTLRADRADVFDRIRDFRAWSDWSPWLLHEPDAELAFSKDANQEGGFYDWDGSFIGSGRIRNERFDGQTLRGAIARRPRGEMPRALAMPFDPGRRSALASRPRLVTVTGQSTAISDTIEYAPVLRRRTI